MAFVDPRQVWTKLYAGFQQPQQAAGLGMLPDVDPTGRQDAAGAQTPAPPGAAPAGKAPPKVLSGDLLTRFIDSLRGLGFQQYDDDNPLGPKGFWAKVGRGGADWLAGQGAWAVPHQFELFDQYGGLDLQDWSKDTDDRAEWLNFLDLYGGKMDAGLAAEIKKWLG